MLGGSILTPTGSPLSVGFQPVPFGFGSVRLSVRFFPWGFPCRSRPCGIVSRLVCHSNYCALRLVDRAADSRNVRSNLHFVRFEALRPVVANPSRSVFFFPSLPTAFRDARRGSILGAPTGFAFICGFQPVPFGFGSVRLSVRFFPWGFPCGSRPCGIVSRLVCHSNYCALRLRRSSGRRSKRPFKPSLRSVRSLTACGR